MTVEAIENLNKEQLLLWIGDAVRRTIFHYGLWAREVEHQLGQQAALDAEEQAWNVGFPIMMERLGKALDTEIQEGIPQFLREKSREQLLKVLEAVSINWLVNDGVWFQSVENRHDIDVAKRCNDTCWSRFSPMEARRIKKIFAIPENCGLDGLKRALSLRLYAVINEQSFVDSDSQTLIFRMNACRVQNARKRKGLADYPCKSGGWVEYSSFARAIDPRIMTRCIACPPDAHPDEWFCSWEFTLDRP